jgi:Type IV secretory system Conjugative DNA transfer
MAQDLANLIGGISADEILRLPSDQQILLRDGKTIRCRQVRYYTDELFTEMKPLLTNGDPAGKGSGLFLLGRK